MYNCFRTYLRYTQGLCAFAVFILLCCSTSAAENTTPMAPNVPESYLKAPLLNKSPDLDPSATWEFENSFLITALYDSLYRFNRKGEVVPSIASSLPQVSGDGKTQTISIKPNVFFNDDPCFKGGKGRAVTASDIVFSIKRIADPQNESGLWGILSGYIEGLDEFRNRLESKKGSLNDPVEGLRAKTVTEIEIRLVEPLNRLVYILGMTEFGIVAPEAVKKYGKSFSRHPVGTGPFQFETCNERELVVTRRHGDSRIKSFGNGTAPDGIKFSFYDDAFSAFRSGNLDFVLIPPNRLRSYVSQKNETKNDLRKKGYSLCKIETPSNYYMLFNYEKKLFHNVHLRKAVALAIPWSTIADESDLMHASFVPRGVSGYVKLKRNFDIAEAKEELKLAGYPDGKGLPEVVIRFTDYGKMLRHAGMVQDALGSIGISAQLSYGEEIIEGADIGFYGWLMDYADAENFLIHLVSNAIPPAGENYGHHRNEGYDTLLRKASVSGDKEQISLYQQAVRHIYKAVSAVPFRQPVEYWALGPRIARMKYSLGLIDWSSIRLIPNS